MANQVQDLAVRNAAAPTPAQVELTKKLLILWTIVTSREDFLNTVANGGLSVADRIKISQTLNLPIATVISYIDNAIDNQPAYVSVASDFHDLAVGAGYDGPTCPADLDTILKLTEGI
jgi:hypothetical protein